MAKMTRNDLKGLVKECLFEILLEATEAGTPSSLAESRKPRQKKAAKRRPALDNIRMSKPASTPAPPPIDVSGITSDPVMAAIFKDTAATTLVEQARAESGKPLAAPADAAALAVANNSPEDLFGPASQNWAALAFGDK